MTARTLTSSDVAERDTAPTLLPASRAGLVRLLGTLTLVAGLVLVPAGIGTAVAIRAQLRAENITLHEDSPLFAGTTVDGPVDALLQAEVIRGHAEQIADGRSYAELDQDDPVRATLLETATLRSSLLTAVMAFGIAALVLGLGVVLTLVGVGMRAIAGPRGPRGAPA